MEKTSTTSKAARETAAANEPTPNYLGIPPVARLENMLESMQELFSESKSDLPTEALTPAERRRMLGSGVRRYGFIDKVSDVSEANPEFAPKFFSTTALKTSIRKIELLRNISVELQQMQRIVDDALLREGDDAFQMALGYYNTVREASRRRQPGAEAIFRALQLFFRRRRLTDDEPTEAEILRDVKATLHGRKDGKIVIENEKPHLVGGKHVVVDETQKPKGAWKATEEGEIDE